MNKPNKSFKVGDLVFAKVVGCLPWPAKIMQTNNKKYTVYFYFAGDTATIKAENIISYLENKEKFAIEINLKHSNFRCAIIEIEAALNGGDAAEINLDKLGVHLPADDTENLKRKRAMEEEDAEALASNQLRKKPPNADIQHDLLLAYSDSKIAVGIKLDFKKPKSFPNEEEKTIWEDNMYIDCCILRDNIELGLVDVNAIKERIVLDPSLSRVHQDELRSFANRMIAQQKVIFMERNMIRHMHDMRDNLGLGRADPDRCLSRLRILQTYDIGVMTLTRNPLYVDTIRRLSKYVGNLKKWKLSAEEEAEFKKKTLIIRDIATEMYENFKKTFTNFDFLPDEPFWGQYYDLWRQFNLVTKHIPRSNHILITEKSYENILCGNV